MKIAEYYSHLNGYQFIRYEQPAIWQEIEAVIAQVDASTCRTKQSKEKRKTGRMLYSPVAMNACFKTEFARHAWKESRVSYWVTRDAQLIRKTLHLSPDEQRKVIEGAGKEAIRSFNQTDFVKKRVALEVQFGKYAFVAFDLFVKHLAFYVGDVIDVGVEILPMKELQEEMSSGVSYYEGQLYNLIREGRGVPPVPLVLIGITQ